MRQLVSSVIKVLSVVIIFTNLSGVVSVAALSQDQVDVFNSGIYYFDTATSNISTEAFCLGGPGGSGPLYGPAFPQISDTATLSVAIKNYISQNFPSSPMSSYSDAYVGLGQKYNVNPALVLAITQKETGIATTGYGPAPKYNIGNIRGGSDSTGFATYPGYQAGLEAIYNDLRSGLYLDPPASDTSISQIMNTYAPPSDGNDTSAYIKFIGDVMQKVLGSLNDIPTDITSSSCPTGDSTASGPVEEGDSSQLAQKILDYDKTGQYNCDNPGDCTDLQKVVKGQSLDGSQGCRAQTLDPRILKLILYIIEVGGFKVGTYAMCGDHSFDKLTGHSGGLAVDISSVNGTALNQDSAVAASDGLKMDKFLNNLPAELHLDQQISYGYGNHYYAPMAALQQAQGQRCNSTCVGFYGQDVENVHTNHIHAGF